MQQPLFLFPGETTCLQGDPRNQAVIVDAKLPTYTEISLTQLQVKRKTNYSAWDWDGREEESWSLVQLGNSLVLNIFDLLLRKLEGRYIIKWAADCTKEKRRRESGQMLEPPGRQGCQFRSWDGKEAAESIKLPRGEQRARRGRRNAEAKSAT